MGFLEFVALSLCWMVYDGALIDGVDHHQNEGLQVMVHLTRYCGVDLNRLEDLQGHELESTLIFVRFRRRALIGGIDIGLPIDRR